VRCKKDDVVRRRVEDGFVAIEWVAAVALLLLPVVVLVATLPAWAERRHTASLAAREATRILVRDWPAADPRAAEMVATRVAIDHGVDADDIDVRVVDATAARGGVVKVVVRMRMPALAVPGGPTVEGWVYTTSSIRRIDDYRSR
jgi:hypothetical protein